MVVYEFDDETADRVFHALSNATRRDILRPSGEAELSVSELAEAYDMSFAAVQKHVAVQERAGLISKEAQGRERQVKAEAEKHLCGRQDLDDLEATWRGRVDRMTGLLARDPKQMVDV